MNVMSDRTPTAARTTDTISSHYYTLDGKPAHEVSRADGKGMRKTTIADARKLSLLPSCTTILKLLDKPALNKWKEEMACLAVLTAKRNEGEELDAFVARVLTTERQQDEVGQIARDRGTEIHSGFEDYFSGKAISPELEPWIRPAINALIAYGELATSESVVVGRGYAGKVDLVQKCEDGLFRIWDIKSSRRLPDPKQGAYSEHKLQCAAYAKAWADKLEKAGYPAKIITGNVYVSTTTPGEFVIIQHENWMSAYEGFAHLLAFWNFSNNYFPEGQGGELDNIRQHYVEATDRIKELERQLDARLASVEEAVNAAVATTTTTPSASAPATKPGLPTVSSTGQKLQWSVGVSATTPKP
jgi:hypothetical protein